MWAKVGWLFVLTTLAFWIGCSTAPDQQQWADNPAAGLSDLPAPPPIETVEPRRRQTPDSAQAEGAAAETALALQDADEQPQAPEGFEDAGVTIPEGAVLRSTTLEPDVETPIAPRPEGEPPLTADRSNWDRTVLGPERGHVAHYPTYYSQGFDFGEGFLPELPGRPSPLRQDGDIYLQAAAATDSDVTLHGQGQGPDALIASFRFAYETLALPVRMVQTPPWQVQVSPEY